MEGGGPGSAAAGGVKIRGRFAPRWRLASKNDCDLSRTLGRREKLKSCTKRVGLKQEGVRLRGGVCAVEAGVDEVAPGLYRKAS